ncbi:putative methylaconitate Delta-isomerase PrpF [Tateyamaria omphalii]|nr:putative methylaconitate Delta-isomerase PrpF [Tateyamaria omphalii]
MILRLFGTPDARQIDGLGGGDKLSSKLAVMGPSDRPECDIDYLFAQVGTMYSDVDWSANCGNISAGAALFAALEGVGQRIDDHQHIAIHQVNTGRILRARVPMEGGQPATQGAFSIGGVPGKGPKIELDFSDFQGSCLNRGVFPTGEKQTRMRLGSGAFSSVSIVDMSNLHIFARAEDLRIDLAQPYEAFQSNSDLRDDLDALRRDVMLMLGLATGNTVTDAVRRDMNPLVYIVASPVPYVSLNGEHVTDKAYNLRSISYSRGDFSKAYPASGAIGTGLAAAVSGTVVSEALRGMSSTDVARIGHPGGILSTQMDVADAGDDIHVYRAEIGRTARHILDGVSYI